MRTESLQGMAAEAVGLNPEQRAAVEHGDGPLLVIAGAGTGKTRVITERIRHLLESQPGLAGENILGLTFTDKAAGEMKHRVMKSCGERAAGVWLGTFHKFCLEHVLQAANPDLQGLDQVDHGVLLRRNLGELGLKIFWQLTDPEKFLRDFVQFFSRCQDELVTPDDYDAYVRGLNTRYENRERTMPEDERALQEAEIARQEELARVYRASERLLRERNLCTFGAQLLQAVQLLRGDASLSQRLRERFHYVLVDEFQDTNIAQLELLWLLAGERRNILAVGDDDQAIYRFRGASFGSFTVFLQRFCGLGAVALAAEAKRNIVSLSRNYRSTQRILRVAGAVISQNERSATLPPKQLITANPDGDKVRIAEFASPAEEAAWVASEIERLHGAGAQWRSFAVLYRKHDHRSELVPALRSRGIPFVIRNFSILGSTLVRDLLAWLRLIANPHDSVACARVLGSRYWRLGPADLVRLAERAERNGRRALSEEAQVSSADSAFSSSADGPRLAEFARLLDDLRRYARWRPASEVLSHLAEQLALLPFPSDAERRHFVRLSEFLREWERKPADASGSSAGDIPGEPETGGTVAHGAGEPLKRGRPKTVRDFMEYLRFFAELGGDISLEEEIADDAIQLMTVHAAKGLEFPHVFILRMAHGDFPSRARRPVFEFPLELMKEEKPAGDFHIQEERRLFYVALTRARQRLTLSAVINKRKRPSEFLQDFLMDRKIQRFDTVQSAPKISVSAPESAASGGEGESRVPPLFASSAADSAVNPARAYSQIALWARAYHPPRPEPLQLSVSAVECYLRCPMQYMFSHLWRLRGGPHAAATFGNVMHTTIREFIREVKERHSVPLDDVLAIYDREWSSAGFPDEYLETEYRKAGREQLAVFHAATLAEPPGVLYQEHAFELVLEDEIVVTGRVDQINRLPSGEIEIVDYKTGRTRDEKSAAEDLQMSVYALAVREVMGLDPARLVLYYLATNRPVATARDAKALDAAKQTISEVASNIRAGAFPTKPNFRCSQCDYKLLCPAHEQLITISSVRAASTQG